MEKLKVLTSETLFSTVMDTNARSPSQVFQLDRGHDQDASGSGSSLEQAEKSGLTNNQDISLLISLGRIRFSAEYMIENGHIWF